MADVRNLNFPEGSLDVAFINACYPNIVDKTGAFSNLTRMMKAQGRIVISHPLGKAFILSLKEIVPFPLDEFPKASVLNETRFQVVLVARYSTVLLPQILSVIYDLSLPFDRSG